MVTTNEVKKACVAGLVKKPKDNKDGSVTFRIGKKDGGKSFTVASGSKYALMLMGANRALVQYEVSESKNPKIVAVISEPSGKTIHHFNRESMIA
jgi:hypothetical protein